MEFDDLFGVLGNERRRLAIEIVDDASTPVALGELAERIAARQLGKPQGALSSSERKAVYTNLYQIHRPKLEDVGAIAVDDRKRVSAGEEIDIFLAHLRLARSGSGQVAALRDWVGGHA